MGRFLNGRVRVKTAGNRATKRRKTERHNDVAESIGSLSNDKKLTYVYANSVSKTTQMKETLQDLLKELEAAGVQNGDRRGMTVREMAAICDLSQERIRELLRLAASMGTLRKEFTYVERIDGSKNKVAAYWIETPPVNRNSQKSAY